MKIAGIQCFHLMRYSIDTILNPTILVEKSLEASKPPYKCFCEQVWTHNFYFK